MTEYQYLEGGNTEAKDRLASSFLFAQTSVGLAATGVLSGLGVTQTGTASANVLVAAGAGVAQDTVANGVAMMINDTQKTLDVLTSNPMGGTPRNDIIVFDSATASIRVIVGTPNASPTDPTVPATAIPLARIRNLASATTVPSAQIDDRRVFTQLASGVLASQAKLNKHMHWAAYTTANLDVSGYATVTHGAGFTPSVVTGSSSVTTFASSQADAVLSFDTFTSTTFRVRAVKSSTSAVITGVPITFTAFLGE